MQTTEVFWNQIGSFNQATAPVQLALFVVAVVVTCLVFSQPGPSTDALTKALLAFTFAWNGVGFFLVTCEGPLAQFVFAPLFVLIGALFAADIFRRGIRFRPPARLVESRLTVFWLSLWVLYPAFGMVLGRSFPMVCVPMDPCPSTVWAIALVAASVPWIDRKLLGLLLPWGLLGLPKGLGMYGCYEDMILFAAGVYGLIVLVRNWGAMGGRRPKIASEGKL